MALSDKYTNYLTALETLIDENHLQVFDRKEIEYGTQIVVTDGTIRLPINIYTSGRIIVQGKQSGLKTLITEWANLQQAGLSPRPEGIVEYKQNRIAKYLVIPENINRIKNDVISKFPAEVAFKETKGAAEFYHVEVHLGDKKVSIIQYKSGTLLVQGLSGGLFDSICDTLDEFLAQSFSDRATRFIPEDPTWDKTASYLENPDAENEAIQWLSEQIADEVIGFLNPNDQQTLTSAAGVRNAIIKTKQSLEDFSVVVMPFAKVYEGFSIKLANYLGLVEKDKVARRSNTVEIGAWLDIIRKWLPDSKMHGEIIENMVAGWNCRNKVIHSGLAQPSNTISTLEDAEKEIKVILGAMSQAYQLFVVEKLELRRPDVAFGKTAFNDVKPIYSEQAFSVSQESTNYWIGVDESGKGDLFGPLVVAGVIINPDIEINFAKLGIRDSKTISDGQIIELAKKIRILCEYEVQILLPPDYNTAYEKHGRNLNELLAWGHAQVISKLARRMPVHHALSDQFGDEHWLKQALAKESCTVQLEQHPKAESDMAVAGASILARAAFVESIQEFSQKSGLKIPLGSSAEEVREVAKIIYRKWGIRGLERIAKMHFKTIREITEEVKR
jgi:ribonuclease HIII